MQATKKQIAEVTAIAIERGFDVESTLKMFSNCSASIYKAIGAEGFVDSFWKAKSLTEANNKGGYDFNQCIVLKVSEKAFFLSLPTLANKEVWVAKSVIVDDIVPFWAVK